MVPKAVYSIAQTLLQFNITVDDVPCQQLTSDSREVATGDVFFALHGSQADGNEYIEQAIRQGASLVIAQCQSAQHHGQIATQQYVGKKVQVVQFFQLNQALCEIAEYYYQQPQQGMTFIGITGTNGKTTTANIIAQLLASCHQSVAIIGTLGAGALNALKATNNTTPGALENFTLLAGFAQQKVRYVAMEVSSHGLVQQRVKPELFDIAVFTNLSRDHLDYHGSMAAYQAAKFSLFNGTAQQVAVINGDDESAKQWLTSAQGCTKNENNKLVVFGRNECLSAYSQYVIARHVVAQPNGMSFELVSSFGEAEINSPLLGDFNVDNLVAAIATLLASGMELPQICLGISQLTATTGRMEAFKTEHKPLAIVDYAHTPDGLKQALQASRQHCKGQLWVVFGCGGDRDQGKRADMGQVAEQYADHLILTNDNPRSEKPETIVHEILSGCQQPENISVVLDRQQAVKAALTQAKPADCILFAGKGHEQNIVIGEQVIAYNERDIIQQYYQEAVL